MPCLSVITANLTRLDAELDILRGKAAWLLPGPRHGP
jgi:hypothetical protein